MRGTTAPFILGSPSGRIALYIPIFASISQDACELAHTATRISQRDYASAPSGNLRRPSAFGARFNVRFPRRAAFCSANRIVLHAEGLAQFAALRWDCKIGLRLF